MSVISRHKIISPKSGSEIDPSIDSRITNLENNEYKILYFEAISTTTGTITKPTNSTILLDQFYSGGDAIVETLSNGQPTGQSPLTVGGAVVSVSSFDASGNYVLSGTPSAFDVALVYIIKIKAVDYVNLNTTNVMAMDDSNKQDTLISGVNIRTVNGSTLLGSTDLVVGNYTNQVIQITSSAAPSISTTGYRKTFVDITAQSAAINLSTNLSGTPINGDTLWYQIKDNGTARVITPGSLIENKGESVPLITIIGKRINIGLTWDSTTSKWGCIAVAIEA